MAEAAETVHHPLFARLFVRISRAAQARGQGEHRRELLMGLSGRVIEVGAGNGLNFAYYPATVAEVLAIEPERYLRDLAIQAAGVAPVPIRVVNGVAGRLPVESAAFDAGVASLMLCSVRDPAAALAEFFRVIRPGGELRFYEHVRASDTGLVRFQRVLDALFWPRVFGGCHTSRDTRAAIEAAGFLVGSCRGFAFRPCLLAFPVAPHVLGTARRP